jgi:VanZ family protein
MFSDDIFKDSSVTIMKMKILKYWGPVILWMGFTFLMSTNLFSSDNTSRIIEPMLKFLFPSMSPHHLRILHGIIRKLAHLTEYFVLSLLLFRAFKARSTEHHGWRWALFSLLVIAIFAAGDEFHQTFVSTRTPSVYDVGIDALGGILGQSVRGLLQVRRQRKNQRDMKGDRPQ